MSENQKKQKMINEILILAIFETEKERKRKHNHLFLLLLVPLSLFLHLFNFCIHLSLSIINPNFLPYFFNFSSLFSTLTHITLSLILICMEIFLIGIYQIWTLHNTMAWSKNKGRKGPVQPRKNRKVKLLSNIDKYRWSRLILSLSKILLWEKKGEMLVGKLHHDIKLNDLHWADQRGKP